jgi:transcriptional regulator with XRE-family HTH domain
MGLRLGVTSGREAIEARVDEELSLLITQLMNEINWHMRERGLTRADLASRMGVSPGRISQVLSGGENLTLRTLASLAAALDARFETELRPQETGNGTTDATPQPAAAVAAERPRTPTPRFDRASAYSRRR